MVAIQSLTRGAIRRSILRNLGIAIIGVATSTTDTSSLIDTLYLLGGDDEHNQKEVIIYDATGSIVDGETSIVDDFASATNDATMSPVFTAAITDGDKYEMLKTPWRIADIEDAINQGINEVSNRALQIKGDSSVFTEDDKYLYTIPSGFTHLSLIEYVYSIGTEKEIHTCDAKWDELEDTDVTASLDTSFKKEGSGSNKLVVAAGAGAGDILLTDNITEVDLSGCTEAQIWIYSTVALSAGDLQLLLDNTAQCASPVESLNIPATTANTWTRHAISLANPQSDSAVISVGIKMVTDKGAFNMWVDDIKAIDALTNLYEPLPIEHWDIARGSTNYLKITSAGLSLAGTGTQLKLSGFRIPVRLDADATVSEIDPGWLINKVTGELLVNHAKSSYLDIHDRLKIGAMRLARADAQLSSITTSIPGTTRVV